MEMSRVPSTVGVQGGTPGFPGYYRGGKGKTMEFVCYDTINE